MAIPERIKKAPLDSTVGSETPTTESVLSQLKRLVPAVIEDQRRFLSTEFSNAGGYGIQGVVVVGSVAAQTERPDSDIDYYLLSTAEGYEDDFDLRLERKAKRATNQFGEIRLDQGERFRVQNWNNEKDDDDPRSNYNTAYEVILIPDSEADPSEVVTKIPPPLIGPRISELLGPDLSRGADEGIHLDELDKEAIRYAWESTKPHLQQGNPKE